MAQAVAHSDFWSSDARPRASLSSIFAFPRSLDRDEAIPLVVIVENDADSRSMLVDLLQSLDFSVIAFASAGELLEAELRDRPGCFIFDAQLPGLSGLELYKHLKACGLLQPVIFLTGNRDIALTVQAMKAGAVDFLLKPVSDDSLLDGVTCAISLDRKRRDAARHLRLQTDRVAALTPREYQVMQGVALGRMNKQIAYDLGISEITVKAHRGNVMRKLEARSVCDLVRVWDMLPSQRQSSADHAQPILAIM